MVGEDDRGAELARRSEATRATCRPPIPGKAAGTATRQKRAHRARARACSRRPRGQGPRPTNAARAAMIRNGAATKTWASTIAAHVSVSLPPKSRPGIVTGRPRRAAARRSSAPAARAAAPRAPAWPPARPSACHQVCERRAEQRSPRRRDRGRQQEVPSAAASPGDEDTPPPRRTTNATIGTSRYRASSPASHGNGLLARFEIAQGR